MVQSKRAVVWDVDSVWYPDISTTYCARAMQGDPSTYIQDGINRGLYTHDDVKRWETVFNDGNQVATIGGAAGMFTAFNKMTKPDGSRILTKEQTIELKQGLLKGMKIGDVYYTASKVTLTDGFTNATLDLKHIYQSAFSDGLAPFVAYWMFARDMDYRAVVPAIIDVGGEERVFLLGSDAGLFSADDKLTGKTLPFDKKVAIKTHFADRRVPLSELAAIDDSEAALPLLKEIQEAGGLAVGFNVLPGQVAKFKGAGIPIIKGGSLLPFAELVLSPTEANLGRYCE